MARRADIDLLFGLLALQNGLIEQGTLFAAFATWAREKDRAMAEILVADGGIDSRERALLEGLVEKHLERHGGDAGKSMASLSSIESVREELSQIDDAELAASLPPARGPGRGEDDPFRTLASHGVGAPTSEGSRFQVLRPHATGGLGQVFVARDTELNRDVALKEIRERYADDPRHRARFEFEAHITGGLEHPGIVPVYGLGCHVDGRPYYAMRFIRGVTLKDAIAEFHSSGGTRRGAAGNGLELRHLLRRFLDVCNAVEYAHQRGVLHRDLKPTNVMLGKHGETLVVDWGLAKAVGRAATEFPLDERTLAPSVSSGSSETLPGSAIGTPAYMSPEQAAGEIERIGPRSDVYSLGATLYTLLTGKPPFEDEDQGRVLEMVRLGRFAPPRQLDRSIDGVLEAICKKAMATAPVDRYLSARALADDIERWMADEAVIARRDPMHARLARSVRRHRSLAAAIAVFLVVALVSSVAAAMLIDVQRAEAERQRGRAETNLALARQVVDEMYTKAAGELENVPRMDDYQRTILERARAFYEQEALPQNGAAATRLAAAGTQLRLAYIERKLGRLDNARANANRAAELFESLIRENPAGLEGRQGYAAAQESMGLIAERGRDFQTASTHFEQAVGLTEKLMKDFPSEPGHRFVLGVEWRELGQTFLHEHRVLDADSALRNATELLEPLVAQFPGVEQYQSALADSLDNLANLYIEQNRDSESEKLRRRALVFRRAALESRPADFKARCDVAWGLNNLGYALSRLKRGAEADAILREAIAACERIHLEHPDLPVNQIAYSTALSHRATVLFDAGMTAEAITYYRRALEVLGNSSRDSERTSEIRSQRAARLYELARAEHAQHLLGDAGSHVRECIRICEEILREQASDKSVVILRGQSWFLRGQVAREQGSIDSALSDFRLAAQSHEAVSRQARDDPQIKGHLVEVLVEGLGKTFRELQRADEALASYRRAADLLAAMDQKDPTDFYNLACCLAQCCALGGRADNRAMGSSSLTDADRAMHALERAIEGGACSDRDLRNDSDLEPLRRRADFQLLKMDLEFPSDPFAR
jgi:eukaryotic-like serine/threonine-protein kinase